MPNATNRDCNLNLLELRREARRRVEKGRRLGRPPRILSPTSAERSGTESLKNIVAEMRSGVESRGDAAVDETQARRAIADATLDNHGAAISKLPELARPDFFGPVARRRAAMRHARTGRTRKMQSVYLVCGVSGSGKSWVCRKLANKFNYIPHDEHYRDFVPTIVTAAQGSNQPIITECPFAERVVRGALEMLGVTVIPVFVIENPDTVFQRFLDREGRPPAQNVITRAATIRNRAEEWGAPHGTSAEILDYLSGIARGIQ